MQPAPQPATFEESDFTDNGIYVRSLRWFRQLIALLDKNGLIYRRRLFSLIVSLTLPSLAVLIFCLGNSQHLDTTLDLPINQTPSPLVELGRCDAFSTSSCLQIAYTPKSAWTREVMSTVASLNNLRWKSDIIGFDDGDLLKSYVASNLGTVQFSIFLFENQSLWIASNHTIHGLDFDDKYYDPIHGSRETPSSYVIFYNSTHKSHDPRSDYHKVNIPLLVLQKSLEHGMLKANHPDTNIVYNTSFAQLWSFSERGGEYSDKIMSGNYTCGEIQQDLFDANVAAPLIFTFGFQVVGLIMFQILTEERHKGLVQSLRTLGLHHSAYWMSWLITGQVIALTSSCFALILAAIIRSSVFTLQHLDFGVLFLFLWLGILCSIANAMFLASFTPSGNAVSIVVFMNFFVAFLTLIFLIFSFNSYQWFLVESAGQLRYECLLSPSTYNSVFDHRPGIGVAQFILFWMPWFHIGRVINEILSAQQYSSTAFYSFGDIYKRNTMFYLSATSTVSFSPPSVSWTFGMMMLLTIVYIVLAWFFSQVSEGLPIEVILIPLSVRKYIEGRHNPVVEGDYRGWERQLSEREESIRAYKISKTFNTVQALKEVSFQIQKGEVFCLLGHNGAGKSTLFNILSGVTSTTHGSVYILGHDCNFEMLEIQQLIGICPQQDYLWDELTALEHMRLYASFKGLRIGITLDNACMNVLSIIGLGDRCNTLAKNFSGGMKRRLSASMSVVGKVKVLYLDGKSDCKMNENWITSLSALIEPTTGLDPISRRSIWNMISIMKKDRVVVLTTHNMEEADYLSDRIMILQNGQVKAIGSSLFLKHTYGTGYQVRLIVEPKITEVVKKEIVKLLPRSTFEEDNKGKIFQRGSNRGAETGSIIVRISKLDYVYFGRFLKWLERLELSSASANVVKEWGISNTSLEQVFIILSESSQTNYRQAANARVNHEEICPLCEANVKEPISFLPFPNNRHLMLPNAICKECHGLPYFLIADEEYSPLLQLSDDESRQIVVSQLFSRAQLLRKNSALNSGQVVDIDEEFSGAIIESSKGSDSSHSQFISESTLAISSELELQSLHHSQMVTQHMHNANEISHDRSKKIRESDLMSITKAMFIKNLQLQSYQRCSTCCVLFLIALMILVVFIMGLLWINPMTCPQGNTVNTFVGETCDIAFQAEYLFHVQNSDNLELHPVIHDVQNIFNISFQVYLSPRLDSSDTEWYFQTTDDYLRTYIQGEFSANNVYGRGDLGLPKYLYRRGTIWANNVETSKEDYESRQSLFFPMNELNGSDFNSNSSEWNEMMFRNQKRNFGDITDGTAFKSSYSFPNCYYSFDMMTNSTGDIQLDYGKYFTDAIFDCQSCALNGGNKSMYFEGTLWVIAIEDSDLYPYAFINFPTPSILQASTASIVEETSSDLKSHSFLRINELIQATDKAKITPDTARDEVCPNNVGAYFPSMYMWDIRNPASVTRTAELTNNTIQAMQFLNILSNSILDPSGKSYLIQGGVSSYSSVAYNYGTSTFLVFLLTMLTVLIMNGIFPMAVWRLSYEKVQTLRLMMNSIGLRDPWYVFSMFLFDLMAMLLINLVVVIIFVQAGLSYFKKVPLGYLIALAILSAYVMASFGFALVRLMPITNSRMATLLATLLNFALGVAGSLICIINFPQVSSDEGSHETIVWPTALSIIPHFAQVRALWVLLTIGEANQEVSNAFALMFAFGTLCLCMECWMSASWARRDLWEVMQHALCSILIKRQSSQKQLLKQEDEEERQGVQLEELECRDETSNCISTVNNLEGEANHVLEKEDDDVAKERRLIDEIFNVSFDNNSADRGKFAILIRNLYHHFTLDDRAAPLVAVNNLSLGVKFGEVFGLLGPNGAGKSTTLSILCGILRPTDGEVYLAGTRVHQPRDQRNSVLQESLFSSTSMGPAFHRLIGICPQQNVCWENLTVAEHLGFQARLRGVEFNRVSAEVQRVAVLIGLDGDAYCSPAGTLSGGQKRRLSIGMSIIADPPIIFLDEPSAGLDPATRQGLWQLIASLRNPNRCIVLTTHSMEEAETLCSRLGVISEGRLLCVGSSLHFKRKFGTGYTLEVSVDNTPDMQLGVDHEQQVEMDSGEIIDKFILEEIAMNTANDASQLLVSAINLTRKYMIPKDSQHQVTVSEIFMKMEMNKKRLRISQWSISETSLEDIFISLVLKNRKGALE